MPIGIQAIGAAEEYLDARRHRRQGDERLYLAQNGMSLSADGREITFRWIGQQTRVRINAHAWPRTHAVESCAGVGNRSTSLCGSAAPRRR